MDEAVQRLYAVPQTDFMATRDELVKTARASKDTELAKAIASLRKPSVSAWAVNCLHRARPDELARLVELGDRLRAAQQAGSGAAMVELGRERGGLVASLVTAAATAAQEAARASGSVGVRLSGAVEQELSQTFTAALASPDAAAAVCSGHLVRALSYAGFGDIDVADATAGSLRRPLAPRAGESTGATVSTSDANGLEAVDERLRREREAAQDAADAAAQALSAASDLVGRATRRQQDAQQSVDDLELRVDEAREELFAGTEQLRQATRRHRDAERAARQALIALDAMS